jgi:LysM repeat protein
MKRLDLLRAAGIATCLIVATSVIAAERSHTVQRGESASSIAKRYYGDYEIADLLLRYNGKSNTVIRPGEKLRIPLCETHRIRAGDSWSGIAKRYLERPSAYREIAALNGMEPDQSLRIGDTVVIPVILTHSLKRGESLASLAEQFYGDADLSRVLQSFNRIDNPRSLAVGQTIRIPLVSFRSRETAGKATPSTVAKIESADRKPPAPPPAEPKKRKAEPEPKPEKTAAQPVPTPEKTAAQPVPTPEKRATAAETKPATTGASRLAAQIRSASEAFANGEYDRARALLESLRDRAAGEGTDTEKADLWRLLAFVYVAFDLPEEACAAHRHLVQASAETKLDPDLVSPKIRRALARCDQGGS